MRLLALALLVPLAAAQQPPVDLATLEAEPFPELVRPLQAPVSTTLRARVSCALTDGVHGVPLQYGVSFAPPWATPQLSPSVDLLPTEACDQGWLEATATLTVTASDRAPAFAPAPIEVDVVAGPAGREQRATAIVDLSASYFSIVDVQLPESIATVAPGEAAVFVARVSNFGNAATRVEAFLVDEGVGVSTEVPAPVTLGSRQQGDEDADGELRFVVRTQPADGFVNRVDHVNVRLTSAYATDDSFKGDDSSLSFLVTTRTGGPSTERLENVVPAPALAAPLALAAALLLARRPFRR